MFRLTRGHRGKHLYKPHRRHHHGCGSVGRAGRLVIGRSPVRIKVSLSKILNPKFCSWWAVGALHGSLRHQCVNGWMWHVLFSALTWKSAIKMQTIYHHHDIVPFHLFRIGSTAAACCVIWTLELHGSVWTNNVGEARTATAVSLCEKDSCIAGDVSTRFWKAKQIIFFLFQAFFKKCALFIHNVM